MAMAKIFIALLVVVSLSIASASINSNDGSKIDIPPSCILFCDPRTFPDDLSSLSITSASYNSNDGAKVDIPPNCVLLCDPRVFPDDVCDSVCKNQHHKSGHCQDFPGTISRCCCYD
ncbi:hypothetical protein ACET3Z_032683 [Daucus carota]